ncbi:MAG: amidase [Burkholderiaceae bacterium]
MTATQMAQALREGHFSAVDLAESCLARIDEVDGDIQAWTFIDREHVLQQARDADDNRAQGRALGALHGVPVGIKDIIDTADMPTEDGTPLHAGRMPLQDAVVVARLRAAGAIVFGKTVTTEFAYFSPGKTRNPHHREHTPGGSSSGSAAAVAAEMVPLAIGTQTNGSVIRPASYCGVHAFKPTHGLVPRTGVLRLSRTLDQLGVFARSIDDLALAAESLIGYDSADADTQPRAQPPLRRVAAETPPLPPLIAFVRTPVWDQADAETHEAFAELVSALGDRCRTVDLPESAREAVEWHRVIMEAEMASNLEHDYEHGRGQLSDVLRALLERGRVVSAVDYQRAKARIDILNQGFAELFGSYDAILTPAAGGVAPRGLTTTGSPVFCTLWTLCGMPALNLPLMHGSHGLPIGAQLVGARGDDARLLRTARWLESAVGATAVTTMGE